MDPGRGYRSFGQMRIDGSGADVQSFGDFRSCELLGLEFILKRYRCSRTSPCRRLPSSRHLESYIPGIGDTISHGDALVRHRPAQRSTTTCRARLRRVGPRSSPPDKVKEISLGNDLVKNSQEKQQRQSHQDRNEQRSQTPHPVREKEKQPQSFQGMPNKDREHLAVRARALSKRRFKGSLCELRPAGNSQERPWRFARGGLRKIASSRRALAAPARCCLQAADAGTAAVIGAAVTERSMTALFALILLVLLAGVLQAVFAAEPGTGPADNAVARRVVLPSAIAVSGIRPTWIGIRTIGAIRTICSCRSSTDGSSTEAHRHSTGYGRTIDTTTIDATAIDASASNATAGYATVINAGMTNANASSIGEGVS